MWYQLLDNVHDIVNMYSNVPELRSVRLMEIDFVQAQTNMVVRFDLPTFADKCPAQWKEHGYNTVQLQIEFRDLQFFNVSGWKGETLADIKIDSLPTKIISLDIISSHCNVHALASKVMILSIKGYTNTISNGAIPSDE